jgi:DNA-binding transcriptional MerR regulator
MVPLKNAAAKSDITFDLNELCERGDVTPRTIRYYVQQGLLPSPGLGAGARYGASHLARLRLIRRLQREHLPLAEIRRRLEDLDDDSVRALLERPQPPDPSSATSAVDYVRAVLGSPGPAVGARPPASSRSAGSPLPAGPGPATPPRPPDRAQWERIALTPDIELHVRRPLSREDNRRVEKLLEEAHAIFKEEEI